MSCAVLFVFSLCSELNCEIRQEAGISLAAVYLGFDSVRIKETTLHFSSGSCEAQENFKNSQRLTKNTDCSVISAVSLDSFHRLIGDH